LPHYLTYSAATHSINNTSHMRTKTLLVTAALTAAGALSSMAQVYSVNIVGYINLTIPVGFSMIANQLNATPDNTLATLLPNAAENTQIFKFNGVGYDASAKSADNPDPSGWSNPTMTLAPGEGAFIAVDPQFAPSGQPVTFVGDVKLVSTVPVPTGFSVASSVLPISDTLDNLGFPKRENDQIFFFNNATKGYDAFLQSADNPDPSGWAPRIPTPAIGQSFFISSDPQFGPPRSWTRTFSVGP